MRASPGHDPSSVDGPPQSQAGPSNLHSTAAESPASTPRKQATAKGRNKFTQEDDEILLRFIRERREIAAAKKIPEDLDGNKIYQAMDAKASLDPCITYVCMSVICNIPLTRLLVSAPPSMEILARSVGKALECSCLSRARRLRSAERRRKTRRTRGAAPAAFRAISGCPSTSDPGQEHGGFFISSSLVISTIPTGTTTPEVRR